MSNHKRFALAPARRLAVPALAAIVLAVAASGCAWVPFRRGAKILPPPEGVAYAEPLPADTTAAEPDSIAAADTLRQEPPPAPRPRRERREEKKPESKDAPNLTPPPPVESVMSPEDRKKALESAVADTTAAGQALRKCAGQQLQPDQETVAESVRSFLAQARAALTGGELWRAESLARKARQLASSLDCP